MKINEIENILENAINGSVTYMVRHTETTAHYL